MGKIINRSYELLQSVGKGGMGEVYKARHLHFETIVAVKKLWQQYSQDQEVRRRFIEEAKSTFKFEHPNIVKTKDLIDFEGEYYIIMEFIDGRSLSDIIHREVGPIETARAIHLFKQILSAVEYIHSQRPPVIHRDLKPQNILVTPKDEVKITDFGIAKVLLDDIHKSTLMKGTPVYMSPEQIMNPSSVNERSDLYSLGMTFYEMLCGRNPFDPRSVTTPAAVYAEVMDGKIPEPTKYYHGIPRPLSDYVMKALNKDPDMRFASAGEMLSTLIDLENDLNLPKPVPTSSPKSKSERKIDRGFFVMGIATILFVSLMTIVALTRKPDTSDSSTTTDSTNTKPDLSSMILVEAGQFDMGCTDSQMNCDSSEKPVHKVKVDSFYLGSTEVTQELWKRVMGNNPSSRKGDNLPVESVSWYDAVEFCNRLSALSNLKKAYTVSGDNITCDFTSNGYRLPTEAEWEYSARGGKLGENKVYSGSNDIDEVAWFNKNSPESQQPVGQKKANELGLFDMSGNVWEWCWDIKGQYGREEQVNPRGSMTGDKRVLRGGGWFSNPQGSRVSARSGNKPGTKAKSIGFRVAQSVTR